MGLHSREHPININLKMVARDIRIVFIVTYFYFFPNRTILENFDRLSYKEEAVAWGKE